MKCWLPAVLLGLGVLGLSVHAETFPSRPVTMIVPFPPGASTDTLSRLIADELKNELGQSVIVENRPGATGLIGVQALSRAARDGYTIGLGNEATHVTGPLMKAQMPFDPLGDFTPLTVAIRTTMAIAVNPAAVPANTLEELIEYAKREPKGVSFGTPGMGSPQHLIGEMLRLRSGGNFVHVPYTGSSPAINDLVAGHIPMTVTTLPALLPHLDRIKILAIGDAERLPDMPDVPTVSETLPDFIVRGWSGYFGPAGLEPEVVGQLSRALVKALHNERIIQAIRDQGLEPAGSAPEDLAALIASGVKQWTPVIEQAHLPKQN